ncbi:MAG: hypothetical protein ACE366_07375 [Bradymonadia bacterium]
MSPAPLALGAGLGLTFAACVAWPLALYTFTLGLFGLPHVIAELRYVGQRFGGRWSTTVVAVVGVLLAGVVSARVLSMLDVITSAQGRTVELSLVALLVAVSLPALWARSMLRAAAGLGLVVAVAWGTQVAPVTTAVVLAGLHNLTPVGFIAEGAPETSRRRWVTGAVIVFLALPALIATGWPYQALAPLGITALEWSPLGAGTLSDHLPVYVPAAAIDTSWAVHLFTAFVFAQCMHYAVVIHGLPRLVPGGLDRRFSMIIAALGVVTLVAFMGDFGTSRRLYGVIAAVHAWIEVPLLLAALLGAERLTTARAG